MTHLLRDDLVAVRARLGWHDMSTPGQRCALVGYDCTASSAAARAYASGWAERNLGAVVIVHVDPAAGATLTDCACALAGLNPPDIPPLDVSTDMDEGWHTSPQGGLTSTSAAMWQINWRGLRGSWRRTSSPSESHRDREADPLAITSDCGEATGSHAEATRWDRADAMIDEWGLQSFPASDPPSNW